MAQWIFGPGSMSWRINRESVLLLGGPAALLMQVAHPLVAAGVAAHSDFPADGVRRLRRTLDAMLSIVFGDETTALRTIARIESIHRAVNGIAPDGRRYDALDPHLKLWVHSTLVESSVTVYETFVAGLDAEERARYYDETRTFATLFAIPDELVPPTLDDLRAWMKERIACGEVVVTPQARALAESILRPLPWVPKRVARLSSFVTAALLPPELREGYGLRLSWPGSLAFGMGRRATRTVLPLVPPVLRAFPAARVAEARAS